MLAENNENETTAPTLRQPRPIDESDRVAGCICEGTGAMCHCGRGQVASPMTGGGAAAKSRHSIESGFDAVLAELAKISRLLSQGSPARENATSQDLQNKTWEESWEESLQDPPLVPGDLVIIDIGFRAGTRELGFCYGKFIGMDGPLRICEFTMDGKHFTMRSFGQVVRAKHKDALFAQLDAHGFIYCLRNQEISP